MDVLIALEARFVRTPDGCIWTQAMFAYPFWQRYLTVFDGVRILARVLDLLAVPSDWQRVDGVSVSLVPVPYYLGPWQYLRQALAVRRAVRCALRKDNAVILRVGSNIASILVPELWRSDHPYGVEVVGDPYDVFSPGAVKHPLRPVFRWWFSHNLRRQCVRACAAAYVTEHALQRRYPPSRRAFTTYFSDVELLDDAFVSSPRTSYEIDRPVRLVLVGSLEQMYKAPDVLLEAVERCRVNGLVIELTVVGDGKHRQELEAMARALSIQDSVRFLGQLTAGIAVREQLEGADLFVLPSRQEGLPRAMIEAMALGLPCIGSTVGGIPELLPPEDMVPPGNAEVLAAKIQKVVQDPKRMAAMSQRNLQKAREFHDDALRQRRNMFYAAVKRETEIWLSSL